MKCKETKQILSAYVDGEFSDDVRDAVRKHLDECAACKTLLHRQMKLREQLLGISDTPTLPDVESSIMSTILNSGTNKKKRRWVRPVLAVTPVVLIIAILLLITLPNLASSPEKVLASASAAILNVQSYRVIDDAYRYDPSTKEVSIQNWRLEAEIANGSFHIHKELLPPAQSYFHEQIGIEGQVYVRGDPSVIVTPEELQEYSPSAKLTQEQLDMFLKIDILPEESIDGVTCFHYRGTVDIEKFIEQDRTGREKIYEKMGKHYSEEELRTINDVSAKTWRARTVTYEFWIGKDDYIIRQWKSGFVSVTGVLDSNSTMEIIKYYDFNVPIVIEPPLDESGALLPEWSVIKGDFSPGN
jgi:competence protein ComGC